MLFEVKGLVVKTVDIKETDRLITIYTEEAGLITALAKGARSLKSRKMSATLQFCYSSFVLYERADKLWVKEACLIESFFNIRDSIEGLALAGYISEVVAEVGTSDAEPDLLRCALNSLYAVSVGKYSLSKIKGAFEIRTSAVLGFMPDVVACRSCAKKEGEFFFDIMAGALQCSACHRLSEKKHITMTEEHESHILCILTEGAKTALGYCIYCPLEKLFSFNISDEDMHLFSRAAEEYLLNHLERGFKSLDFYNEVKR